MILGLSLPTFAAFHVILSVIGIGSGMIVLFGLLDGQLLRLINLFFLVTTVATSVTGFLFPFKGITPGIKIGILSLIALAVAMTALYRFRLAGRWRATFVVSAMVALYFNIFVLIVQLFEKVPALHALAPTQTELPFLIAQIVLLLVFIVLTIMAEKNFQKATTAKAA
jgi:hypothetical protein